MADSPTLAPDPTTVTVTETPKSDAPPSVGFHALKGAERDAFLKDGTMPSTPPADQPADAATATPGEQAASTDATQKTASEPVDPAKKKGKGVKERTAELDAEIRELNDRLRIRAELSKQLAASEPKPKPDAKTDSSTTATSETPDDTYERLANHPDAPDPETYTDLKKWGVAMAHFVASQVAKEAASTVYAEREQAHGQQAAHTRELEAVAARAADRIDAEKAKDPTLPDRIHPDFRGLPPARVLPDGAAVGPHHYAKDLITFESEHPLQLSAFYSGSAEGIAEWQRLMQLSTSDIQREIAYRDVSFRSTQAASVPAAAAKPFTKTPEPPAALGTKPAGVFDKKKAAEGNFDAMWALLDAEDGTETRKSSRR